MNIYNCLFFDIETTTQYKDINEFEKLDPLGFKVFQKKQERRSEHDKSWTIPLPELYTKKLGITSFAGIKRAMDHILKIQGIKQKVAVVSDGARILLR